MCLFLATVLYAVICSLPLVRAEGNCTFASRERIIHLFTALAKKDYPTFFGAVVDNVNWTVQGTHPLAGQYYNKTYFVINSIARLSNIQNNSAPNGMDTFNIVGGCNEEWSSQEISSHQVMKNGFRFQANFNWMTRWNTDGMIVQGRAYLDSALVAKVVQENERQSNSSYLTPRLCVEPGPGGLPNLTDALGYNPEIQQGELCTGATFNPPSS